MPIFSIQRHVDEDVFRTAYRNIEFSSKPISDEQLPELFKKTVIQSIVDSKRFNPDELVLRFGFKSEDGVREFLRDPDVSSKLIEAVRLPAVRLPYDLYERIELAYANASQNQQGIPNYENRVLVGLFDLFELIKTLSDDEIGIIESYLPSYTLSSLNGSTLKEFRDDLHRLPLLEFETKYEGCFNGLLENFIKPLIDGERLHSLVEEMRTIKAESEATGLTPNENIKEDVHRAIKFKEKLNDLKSDKDGINEMITNKLS